jgi:hypothetical protein
MDRARTLAVVSAAQLAAGVAGMVVALRRVHPCDVLWMHGQPDAIARDTLFKGTPCRPRCPRWSPRRRAARGLRIVGLTMVAGYLGERLVRQRLRPAGWDALESPLIIAALGLSVGMAALSNLRPAPGTNPEHPLAAGS